jgi:hypothetical protein
MKNRRDEAGLRRSRSIAIWRRWSAGWSRLSIIGASIVALCVLSEPSSTNLKQRKDARVVDKINTTLEIICNRRAAIPSGA